ncbi:hypothetical protein F4781DRAFT_405569 [Annulohypoxylon bovei var. microspora]|nr:hypothetical protein F4781DRAFT_405569 [Annulohypoxylon bovei var. microspora]
MESTSSTSTEGDKSINSQSWASVASVRSPDTYQLPGNTGKVTFRPKSGKKEPAPVTGQHAQQEHAYSPRNDSNILGSSFASEYMDHVLAEDRMASYKSAMAQQATMSVVTAPSVAGLNAQISSMGDTISALYGQISQKNSELDQVRASLAGKDSELEEFKTTVEALRKKLEETNSREDEVSADNEEIIKLKLENAGLRDSIHTGIVNILQVYGPGSVKTFSNVGAKEAQAAEHNATDFIGCRQNVSFERASEQASSKDSKVSSEDSVPNSQEHQSTNASPAQIAPSSETTTASSPVIAKFPNLEQTREVVKVVPKVRQADTIVGTSQAAGNPSKQMGLSGKTKGKYVPKDIKPETSGKLDLTTRLVNGESQTGKWHPIVRLPPPADTNVGGSEAVRNPQTSNQPTSAKAPAANTAHGLLANVPRTKSTTKKTSIPTKNNDGWTVVPVKKIESSKTKWKKIRAKKLAARKQADVKQTAKNQEAAKVVATKVPDTNQGPVKQVATKQVTEETTAASSHQNVPGDSKESTKPSTKAQVAAGKVQKKPAKKPRGTVIGSNSSFSQKKPQDEKSAEKKGELASTSANAPDNKVAEPKHQPQSTTPAPRQPIRDNLAANWAFRGSNVGLPPAPRGQRLAGFSGLSNGPTIPRSSIALERFGGGNG